MMQDVRPGPLMQFRAQPKARACLPLSVRSVGRFRVGEDWRESFAPRWFMELFWTVEGQGCFYAGKRKFVVKSGDIFVYAPGSPHRIESLSPRWEYCWVTFDHADCVRWLNGFGLGANFHTAAACPIELFESIGRALAQGTLEGEYEASQHAHALLIDASRGGQRPGGEGIERAKTIMDERFADPALSVEALAAELSMHRTTLYRLFLAQYGLNPKHYLMNLRLHQALQLIQQTQHPVGEIARMSGFNDPDYLSRLIKKTAGISARKIRSTVRS